MIHKGNTKEMIKTRLHFTSDFLQENNNTDPRIILQMSRSTTNVFEAVQKTGSMCLIGFKTRGAAECFKSNN